MGHFFSVWHVVGGLALLGAWAIVLGWRGRRIDDHPSCRKCHFDLSGSPALPATCPECGRDLSRRRGIAVGQRGRRPIVVGIGVVLLLLAVTTGGLTIYSRMSPINWYAHMPAWWLVGDLSSGDGAQVEAALGELVKREEAGELSARYRGALTDHLFESVIPGLLKTKVEWAPGIERAWRAGELTEARRLAFATYAAGFTLRLTPRTAVQQNEYLEMCLEPRSPVRGRFEKALVYRTRLTTVELAGIPYDLAPPRQSASVKGNGSGFGGDAPAIAVLIEPGDYVLHTIWDIQAGESGDPDTMVHWQQVQDVTVTVLPPGDRSLRFLIDDETAERIREAMHIRMAGLRDMTPEDDQIDVIGTFGVDLPDIDVSLEVEIRDGDQRIGGAGCGNGLGANLPLHFRLPAGREIESVDFIVRPSVVERSSTASHGAAENERPVWAGPPFTVRSIPVQWFENLESDGLDTTLRKRFSSSIAWWIESWPERSEDLRDTWP